VIKNGTSKSEKANRGKSGEAGVQACDAQTSVKVECVALVNECYINMVVPTKCVIENGYIKCMQEVGYYLTHSGHVADYYRNKYNGKVKSKSIS
jgi:hypothetical protein